MQPLSLSAVSLVVQAANDLPVHSGAERARRRQRDRKLRGPTWAEPKGEVISA